MPFLFCLYSIYKFTFYYLASIKDEVGNVHYFEEKDLNIHS
jgi:hypothetical protein